MAEYNFVDIKEETCGKLPAGETKRVVIQAEYMEETSVGTWEALLYKTRIDCTGYFDGVQYQRSIKYILRRVQFNGGWRYEIVGKQGCWHPMESLSSFAEESVIHTLIVSRIRTPEAVFNVHGEKFAEIVELGGQPYQKPDFVCVFSLQSLETVDNLWGTHVLKVFPVGAYNNLIMSDSKGRCEFIWMNFVGRSARYPKRRFRDILDAHTDEHHAILIEEKYIRVVQVKVNSTRFSLQSINKIVKYSSYKLPKEILLKKILWSRLRNDDSVVAFAVVLRYGVGELVRIDFNKFDRKANSGISSEDVHPLTIMKFPCDMPGGSLELRREASIYYLTFGGKLIKVKPELVNAKEGRLSQRAVEYIWLLGLAISGSLPGVPSPRSSLVLMVRNLVLRELLEIYEGLLSC